MSGEQAPQVLLDEHSPPEEVEEDGRDQEADWPPVFNQETLGPGHRRYNLLVLHRLLLRQHLT